MQDFAFFGKYHAVILAPKVERRKKGLPYHLEITNLMPNDGKAFHGHESREQNWSHSLGGRHGIALSLSFTAPLANYGNL